jgi:hypothetical protein
VTSTSRNICSVNAILRACVAFCFRQVLTLESQLQCKGNTSTDNESVYVKLDKFASPLLTRFNKQAVLWHISCQVHLNLLFRSLEVIGTFPPGYDNVTVPFALRYRPNLCRPSVLEYFPLYASNTRDLTHPYSDVITFTRMRTET